MLEIHLSRWPMIRISREQIRSDRAGWIALWVMILASSTYNSFAKELGHALSPLSLLFVSELLTAFFVLLAFGAIPTVRRLARVKRAYIIPLVSLGLVSGVTAPLLFFTGLSASSAVNAELFSRIEMVALPVLACLFLKREHLTKAHLVAGIVIMAGIVFVALKGFTEMITLRSGDPLILISGVTFAFGSLIFKKYLHDLEPELVIVSRGLTAVLTFLVLSPFLEHPLGDELHAFPMALVPALLGFGFLARFLNLFTFYEAVERIPVSSVSLFSTTNIIIGVLFAALYLREPILWYHFIGGAMIVMGALLLQVLGVHESEKGLEQHLKQHHRHHL